MRDFDDLLEGMNAGLETGADEQVLLVESAEAITITGSNRIFSAEYAREGSDLVLSNPGLPDLRLVDYFDQTNAPTLIADNGAELAGTVVSRLAGPLMPGLYAQAGGGSDAILIGQVETLEGVGYAERADGTRVTLELGSKIYENDVLITEDGAKMSVTFVDGTIFTLASASRMVIDSLIYDPTSSDGNGGAFSLVQGGFVFIAGEVARTGGMDVATPTATMGIRGTTVLVEITTVDGVSTVELSLNRDPDGGIGSIEVFDLSGNLITTIDTIDSKWVIPGGDEDPFEVARTAEELDEDSVILLDAARAYAQAFERVEQGGRFVEIISRTGDGPPPEDEGGLGIQGNQSDPDEGGDLEDDLPGGTVSGGGQSPDIGGPRGEAPEEPGGGGNGGGNQSLGPELVPDEFTGDEDGGPIFGDVFANDPESDGFVITDVVGPTHGVLTFGTETSVAAGPQGAGEFYYYPDGDFNGTDSFSYTVSDGQGNTSVGTVTLIVSAVEDAPRPVADTVSTDADAAVVLTPETNDEEPDGDPLNILGFGTPAHGSVGQNEGGEWVYTPDEGYEGTDTFSYDVSDGKGNTSTSEITVTVLAGNELPTPQDDLLSTDEDTDLALDLLVNDSDPDGDPLTIVEVGLPSEGQIVEDGEGGYLYRPTPGVNGSDSFTYTVSDGQGGTATASVVVNVLPVNYPPVAVDDEISLAEDGTVALNLLANDSDPDGDSLSGVLGTPSNGEIIDDGAGGLSYRPNADFFGTDSFTYTVSDGQGGSDSANVQVTVTPVDDAPVAPDISRDIDEDSGLLVINPDLSPDADGQAVSLVGIGASISGTVEISGDAIHYTPAADFYGTEVFSYTLEDEGGTQSTGQITVNVASVNDDPIALDDDMTTSVDMAVTFNVLDNDSDPDGTTPSLYTWGTPNNGTLTHNGGGSFTYVPDLFFEGIDKFTYQIEDGDGGFATGVATIDVADVNNPPVIDGESVTTYEDYSYYFYDFSYLDPDYDYLEIIAWGDGANGAVTSDMEGGLVYTPIANFFGTDSFSITLSDGEFTVTGEIEIIVEAQEDTPIGQDETISIPTDAVYNGQVTASDADGDTLSFAVTSDPVSGELTLDPVTGSYSYQPFEAFVGVDSFEVEVSDGNSNTDAVIITLEVAAETYESAAGQAISMAIDMEGSALDPAANLQVDLGDIGERDANLVLVIDGSEALTPAQWTEVQNNLAGVITGLAEQYGGLDTLLTVQLVQYGNGAQVLATGDVVGDETTLLAAIAGATQTGNAPDWGAPLALADTFFDGAGAGDANLVYFLSAGTPTSNAWFTTKTTLEANHDVNIQTFGLGGAFDETTLAQMDSDGSVMQVPDTGALLDAFQKSVLFSPEMVSFTLMLEADGSAASQIANSSSPELVSDGINYELPLATIPGIADLLGEENVVTGYGSFDTDGDAVADVFLNTVASLSPASEAQDITGGDGADLLLGSNDDDLIAGGAGDDVILGFGGEDELAGGAGDDVLRGGAGDDILTDDAGTDDVNGGLGRDTLKVLAEAGAGSDLLGTLSGSQIEAIDIDNGVGETLDITLADLVDLSDEKDVELNGLSYLVTAHQDSATIYGDSGDTVNLESDGTGDWVFDRTLADYQGNYLDVYHYEVAGVVQATIGIDDEVTVNTGFGAAA